MRLPLTEIYQGNISSLANATPKGCAFWSGTGPSGASCGGCAFFRSAGYYAASNQKHGPTSKPGTCAKYSELMGQSKKFGKIPYRTSACKYYEVAETKIPYTDPKGFNHD